MFPEHFTSIHFFQKKRNVLLYKASDGEKHYVLKCSSSSEASVRQSFEDEYHVMSRLSHPSIPAYYGLSGSFLPPDQDGRFLTLCMEDCSGENQPLSDLTFPEILNLLEQTAQVLLWLLAHGVLYTDLNPSNLILHHNDDALSISLVDYTGCYYFLTNPHPAYSLRFSYDLSPSLKGQQLLIQELAYFLQDLIGDRAGKPVPSGIYPLMETGMNPSGHLSLEDYIHMIHGIRLKYTSCDLTF